MNAIISIHIVLHISCIFILLNFPEIQQYSQYDRNICILTIAAKAHIQKHLILHFRQAELRPNRLTALLGIQWTPCIYIHMYNILLTFMQRLTYFCKIFIFEVYNYISLSSSKLRSNFHDNIQ